MLVRSSLATKTLLRLGMLFLLAACLIRAFLHSSHRVEDNIVDALLGVLFGMSIALNLLSIVVKKRRHSGMESSCEKP